MVAITALIFTMTSTQAGNGATVIGNINKDQLAGHISTKISGVCGQDYRLVSPTQATEWKVFVNVLSEMETQPVHIWIFEVIGKYPYNYEEQKKNPKTPYAKGIGKRSLTANLDPSKTYEVWIRDAYAKPLARAGN